LTLLVIPTVYEIFDEWREWLMGRAARFFVKPPAHKAEPEESSAD
jgi:hypothetical protein